MPQKGLNSFQFKLLCLKNIAYAQRDTESNKSFRLNIYEFYLVILLPRYHIKSLDMTKTQGFREDLWGYDLFLYP